MMKNSEILELSTEDILARIQDEEANLSKLKFAHAVSAIENPNRITFGRKTIARLRTELTVRRRNEQESNEIASEAKI